MRQKREYLSLGSPIREGQSTCSARMRSASSSAAARAAATAGSTGSSAARAANKGRERPRRTRGGRRGARAGRGAEPSRRQKRLGRALLDFFKKKYIEITLRRINSKHFEVVSEGDSFLIFCAARQEIRGSRHPCLHLFTACPKRVKAQ